MYGRGERRHRRIVRPARVLAKHFSDTYTGKNKMVKNTADENVCFVILIIRVTISPFNVGV